MMTDTITIEDARAIIHGLDPEELARRVWRAASVERGQESNAAAVLDLTDGALLVLTWQPGGVVLAPTRCVVLAWTTDVACERTWRLLSGTLWVAPSVELVEEEVARRAAEEGLYFPCIEEQLGRAYAWGRRNEMLRQPVDGR